MKLKLGDIIYLSLQLFDGIASMPKRVFVELRDVSGVLIEPLFEILHVDGGEFRNSARTMPSDEFVTASYFVYNNDGTTLDNQFAAGKDIFMRDFTGEIVASNLDAKVSSAFAASLIGEIEDSVLLSGELPTEEILTASLLDIEILEGTIEEEVII